MIFVSEDVDLDLDLSTSHRPSPHNHRPVGGKMEGGRRNLIDAACVRRLCGVPTPVAGGGEGGGGEGGGYTYWLPENHARAVYMGILCAYLAKPDKAIDEVTFNEACAAIDNTMVGYFGVQNWVPVCSTAHSYIVREVMGELGEQQLP